MLDVSHEVLNSNSRQVAPAPRLTEALPLAALYAIDRIEHVLDAPNRELAAKVRTALGLHYSWTPRAELGETITRFCVWSVRELDAVLAAVGGTITAQQVERTLSDDTTFTVTEVTVTVDILGIGTVQVFTDWDPADEEYGYSLAVIRAIAVSEVA